jgi:hypothetical protein
VSSLPSPNPSSSRARVDSEDMVAGDAGCEGGVSGRGATLRYPFTSRHIFDAGLRFAARRRRAKRKNTTPKTSRAAPMVMAAMARTESGLPGGGAGRPAVCEGGLGSTWGGCVGPQHPISIVKVELVISKVGRGVMDRVGCRWSRCEVARGPSRDAPCIVVCAETRDQGNGPNPHQPPGADEKGI